MNLCLNVLGVVVVCLCVVQTTLSLPQPQPQGVGVPLPPPSQHTFEGHGVTASIGHQGSVQGPGGGAQLGPQLFISGETRHNTQHHRASLSGGVPLPPPSHTGAGASSGGHPALVVPFTHSGGVPLPHPSVAGGRGLPPGVPLPPVGVSGGRGLPPAHTNTLPHKNIGEGGTAGFPPLIQGVATLKPIKDVHQDSDVQKALKLPAVHSHVQLKTRADHAVRVGGVISAHKQIVSGQVLYLTLRVKETKCPIGVPDVENCPLDPSEDDYICEVAVWERPWLNSSKVISEKSSCAEEEDDNDFKRWGPQVLLPVASSQAAAVQEMPRGVERQQVGVEAFNYVDRGSESKFRGELIKYDITSIKFDPLTDTTQMQVDVEYGFTLCLKPQSQLADNRKCPADVHRGHYICSVVVLHNPNLILSLEVVPILDDDDDIHCERKNAEEELVVPVVTQCAGCPQPVPLNDPTILEVADFALKEYDRISTDEDDLHILLHLVKAHSQVMGGIKYFLTMELAESLCKKTLTGADVNRTFCGQDFTEETKMCDVHVIDQPWVPARDLISARCYDKDNYPTSSNDEFIVPVSVDASLGAARPDPGISLLSGGEGGLNVAEDSIDALKFVVEEFNRREDDQEYYKLIQVYETSSQVEGVGGRRHHIVVELGETRCRKNSPSAGKDCPLDPTEEHEVCEADVYEQLSGGNHRSFNMVSLRCDDLDDYLRKKFIPALSPKVTDHPFLDAAADTSAGYHPLATNNSVVHQAAQFVADQFNLHEDEDELYILDRVTSSLSQSSSEGVVYHLEVVLAETHCKKYQFVADPKRCPVDRSEEMEVCQAEVLLPQAPATQMQLKKLFCDEMNDYFSKRLVVDDHGGNWMDMNVSDDTLMRLGHLIADEYDFRSDEDSLFILHKVLKARQQVSSGIKYQLVVELLETVCPKYKRRINKARCAPDIGEDHVVCEAHIFSQPWLQRDDISHLQCADKDEFFGGGDSLEVFYPKVHPSAHARPVFKSHFIVRTSDESEESNERYYDPSRRSSGSRSRESRDDDSDERFYRFSGRRNLHHGDSDEQDSDERQFARSRSM